MGGEIVVAPEDLGAIEGNIWLAAARAEVGHRLCSSFKQPVFYSCCMPVAQLWAVERLATPGLAVQRGAGGALPAGGDADAEPGASGGAAAHFYT